ncbi:MAG: hypothetical protein A2Z99_02425 [Treponema sp. GWB1_62_6]|nr:MAG: hypothetical protein A2Z99_02425 [Treponema sp. GWB1_62_6]
MKEGDELELDERRDGILIRSGKSESVKISWEESYGEMVAEAAERDEWSDWDAVPSGGQDD